MSTKRGEDQVDISELCNLRIYPEKTVLLIAIGATLGKVAVANCACSSNQQINALIPSNQTEPLFLLFCMIAGKLNTINSSNMTTLGIINQEKTGMLQMPFARKEEQQEICKYLLSTCEIINDIQQRIHSSILLLQEYRSSLITAIVSGQIEVPKIE